MLKVAIYIAKAVTDGTLGDIPLLFFLFFFLLFFLFDINCLVYTFRTLLCMRFRKVFPRQSIKEVTASITVAENVVKDALLSGHILPKASSILCRKMGSRSQKKLCYKSRSTSEQSHAGLPLVIHIYWAA